MDLPKECIRGDVKTKKRKRKKIRVPVAFNKSRSINAGLNSTILKASLHANNRALARALQTKKEELNTARKVIYKMHKQEQEHLMEKASTRELNAKIKEYTEKVQQVLYKVLASQNSFTNDITDVLDICSKLQKSIPSGNVSPAHSSMGTVNICKTTNWIKKPVRVPKDHVSTDSCSAKTLAESGSEKNTIASLPGPSVGPTSDVDCLDLPSTSDLTCSEHDAENLATDPTSEHQANEPSASRPSVTTEEDNSESIIRRTQPHLRELHATRQSASLSSFVSDRKRHRSRSRTVERNSLRPRPSEEPDNQAKQSQERDAQPEKSGLPAAGQQGRARDLDSGIACHSDIVQNQYNGEAFTVKSCRKVEHSPPTLRHQQETTVSAETEKQDSEAITGHRTSSSSEQAELCDQGGEYFRKPISFDEAMEIPRFIQLEDSDKKPGAGVIKKRKSPRNVQRRRKNIFIAKKKKDERNRIEEKVIDSTDSVSKLATSCGRDEQVTFLAAGQSIQSPRDRIVKSTRRNTYFLEKPVDVDVGMDEIMAESESILVNLSTEELQDDMSRSPLNGKVDDVSANLTELGEGHDTEVNVPPQNATVCETQEMELTAVMKYDIIEGIPAPDVNKDGHNDGPVVGKNVNKQGKMPNDGRSEDETGELKSRQLAMRTGKAMPKGARQVSKIKRSQLPKWKNPVLSKRDGKQQDQNDKIQMTANTKPVKSSHTKKRTSNKKSICRVEPAENQKPKQMMVGDTESMTGSHKELDDEILRKKFTAYLVKPGKISFTTCGKELVLQQQRSRSKSRSILPTMSRACSKPRSKPNKVALDSDQKSSDSDSVFDFISPSSRRTEQTTADKSTADVSLSKSTCEPKPSYSQFCGREMPHPKLKKPIGSEYKEDTEMASPHGIMLVLGNGKRKNPRARRKTVHYKKQPVTIYVTDPNNGTPRADDGTNAGSESASEQDSFLSVKPMALDAGNTPIRSCRERSICAAESPSAKKVTREKERTPTESNSASDALLSEARETTEDCSYDSPIAFDWSKRKLLVMSYSESDDSPASSRKQRHARQSGSCEVPGPQSDEKIKGRKSKTLARSHGKVNKPEKSHKNVNSILWKNEAVSANEGEGNKNSSRMVDGSQRVLDLKSNKTEFEPRQVLIDKGCNEHSNGMKEEVSESTNEDNQYLQNGEQHRKRRRAATSVTSYAEPKRNKKLRCGDDYTSTIYQGVELLKMKNAVLKTKKTSAAVKKGFINERKTSSVNMKRRALSEISNVYSSSGSN